MDRDTTMPSKASKVTSSSMLTLTSSPSMHCALTLMLIKSMGMSKGILSIAMMPDAWVVHAAMADTSVSKKDTPIEYNTKSVAKSPNCWRGLPNIHPNTINPKKHIVICSPA